jgi:hypothetical protein
MARVTPRLNYYFQPCEVVTAGGASVKLDGGFGVVAINDGGDREEVYFPDQTARYVLVSGEINRLEKKGLAERYGQTWKD